MGVEVVERIFVTNGDQAAVKWAQARRGGLLIIKTNEQIRPKGEQSFIHCLDYTAPDRNPLGNNSMVNFFRKRELRRKVDEAIKSDHPVYMILARLVPNRT